jgi:hypothetical protein
MSRANWEEKTYKGIYQNGPDKVGPNMRAPYKEPVKDTTDRMSQNYNQAPNYNSKPKASKDTSRTYKGVYIGENGQAGANLG